MTLDVDDLLPLRAARRARVAPGGGAVAFLIVSADLERDGERSDLHVVALDAEGGERVLAAGIPAREPSWSPDGREIAFLADGVAHPEVGILALDTGETRRLAVLPGEGSGLTWSPDGERVALAVRNGAGGRIAVVEVGTGALEMVPSGEGQEDSAPAWSPDGLALAFARSEAGSAAAPPSSSIQIVPADGRAGPATVPSGLSFATCPSWAPSGELLACVGSAASRLAGNDPCLQPWILPASGGAARLAARGVNGVVLAPVPEGPAWAADGSAIFFREAREGEIAVVRAEVEECAEGHRLTRGCQVVDFSRAANGTFAYIASTPDDPGSVRVLDESGSSSLGPGAWAGGRVPEVPALARRRFRSPHGPALDGWLQGLDRDRSPQPLLVSMHGGPHGFFGPSFQAGHFYRNVLAARGWLVLTLNSSGSGSYGEAFADAIRGRWGEHDLPEHLAALEEVVADGLADPARLAVAGYSYGGYLAAWAVCHDHRFRAAVVGAPITDLAAFERASDIGAWYTPWEMRGGLPENAERYERLSPIAHAGAIRTPVLLLHGDADRRCPLAQSESLAERIAAAGRSRVELVRYKGGDHLFHSGGRPSQRLDFNRRIVEWLEEHVNGGDPDE
ncbi:MAG TPA: S9 family peptidase [Solirubrobacterales bacterium]|nr:S9 family peptidase [Solirubrobacterales bacterium]